MKHILKKLKSTLILGLSISLTLGSVPAAHAIMQTNSIGGDEAWLRDNDINYWDTRDSTESCTPSASTSGTSEVKASNKDYKGRPVISEEQLAKITKLRPLYEKAAKDRLPWQILAVLHIRESLGYHASGMYNPPNGQGVYQFVAKAGKYPEGVVTSEDFVRQSSEAVDLFTSKGFELGYKAVDFSKGDPKALKDVFFSYNGRANAYVLQAKQLGFNEGYEGSPYVMNLADAKRDPDSNPTGWGQIKRDYGGIEYPANKDPGSFVIYSALAGIPSSSGNCGSSGSLDSRVGKNGWEITGTNKMQLYYQYKSPWAEVPYQFSNVKDSGCAPTSVAMAAATLNNKTDITPKAVTELFAKNNGLTNDGTSWAMISAGSPAEKAYGIKFTELGTNMERAKQALKRGSFVVMSQNAGGGSIFTTGGHIMLLRGYSEDEKKYFVADPNSEKYTGESFTEQQIIGPAGKALANMWEISK